MQRDLSGKERVLIHGQYAPILGRIWMDQLMVDVSHIKESAIGDTVTIFGKDGEKNIPVEEIAEKSHSFKYECVCSITNLSLRHISMVLPLAVTISPESAGSSPTMIRSSVVLPAPLIPTMAARSPSFI